jgi:hypothetical protein
MKGLQPNACCLARGSRKVVSQTRCVLEKGNRPANHSPAIGTESFRRRGSGAFVVNPFARRSLVRRQSPACSHVVENLDSPQHDNDGRYQRGRRQYTFYGSDSHTALPLPSPVSGLDDSLIPPQLPGHNAGNVACDCGLRATRPGTVLFAQRYLCSITSSSRFCRCDRRSTNAPFKLSVGLADGSGARSTLRGLRRRTTKETSSVSPMSWDRTSAPKTFR